MRVIGILMLWIFSLCLSAQNVEVGKGNVVSKDTARTVVLQDVVITAPMKEVEMKGDTTVINAGAYKTSEGAYLEELVKSIPGLEYDSQNHSITYNGLPINAINVNGESFFGGNMQMALENLPAKLVNRIKVYDKRSELEKITKVRKGGENYVLDLQTKKEFNGTMMASAETAWGNNHKKNAQLIGNLFREGGENLSLVTNTGNKNLDTRYSGNRQDNASVNISKHISKGLTLFGNLMYNHSVNGNETAAYNEQYLTSGNRYQHSAGNSLSKNHIGNGSLGMRWSINDKTYLNINANGSLSKGDYSSESHNATYTAQTGMDTRNPFSDDTYHDLADSIRVNDIRMSSLSQNINRQLNLQADFTRVLNDKGTSLSVTAQTSQGSATNKSTSISSTTYYQLQDALGGDSILYRNQYNHSPSSNHLNSIGFLFTQPLTKDLYLQLSYTLSHNLQRNERSSYDLSSAEAEYVDSLSNHSLSSTTTHDIALNLSLNNKVWEMNANLSIRPEHRSLEQKTGLAEADTVRTSINFSPMLTLAWRKKKTRIQFCYNGETQQPSLSDLLTLTDNSDPLNITHGNPQLKAAYNQRLRLEARNTRIGLSGDVNFSNTYNSQTQAVIYNLQTGARESYPVNINGNWNLRSNLRYNHRFNKQWNISARMGAAWSENVSLVNERQSEQPGRSLTSNTTYTSLLRLGYTPEWGGFDLSGNWQLRHSSNQLRQTSTYTRNYAFALNAYATLPLGIQLKTNASYSFRNGTNIRSHADDESLWNMEASWRFLKKKAEISFRWNDILSDKKSYYRNITSNGLSESYSQQIGSYFLVAFKYHLNKQL